VPRDQQCASRAEHNRKTERKIEKQTPYLRNYCRRALYDLPQTLHGDRGRPDYQKSGNHFLIQRSFSYKVHGKIRGK